MKKHILYLVADDGYFVSHRLHLAKATLRKGYKVTLVTSPGIHIETIQANGIKVITVPFKRGSLSPIYSLKIIGQIYKIYKEQKPDIVHHVALMPTIFGTIAAKIVGIKKIINAVAGMGYVFTESTYRTKIIQFFMKIAFKALLNKDNQIIIVQNHDDEVFFRFFLTKTQIVLIPGAGISIDEFYPKAEPLTPPYIINLVARMLWTKGIKEFVEASKILKRLCDEGKVPLMIFQLVGSPDPQNPASIPNHILKQWHDEGNVVYLNQQNDIASIYQNSHMAVLPSYREGLPKSLLEAAACGKPIITCDVPGCRMIVKDGYNGFLIPSHNVESIVNAIIKLLNNELREKMGQNSRNFIVDNFTEAHIQAQTINLYFK